MTALLRFLAGVVSPLLATACPPDLWAAGGPTTPNGLPLLDAEGGRR